MSRDDGYRWEQASLRRMQMDLNAAQRQAVQTRSGPLLVLAGAGTGKTRVVTCRIAQLIRSGIGADRILAVTFTKKAATEMQQRVGQLLGRRKMRQPEISTFHSLCVRILRRQAYRLGVPRSFAIYDRADQESVARGVLREIRVPTMTLGPGDLLGMISRWKSSSVRPLDASAIAETDKEHIAAAAYRRYQQWLKNAGALDFDDLLLCTEDLLTQFHDVRATESGRFDHVLVDEYQDTNASQYRIIRAMVERHRNICVVGDDDQSIYGWRGADVEHILRFTGDWPDAKVVRLEENYRSTAPILEMAGLLIACNKRRHPKGLRPSRTGGSKPQIKRFKDENEEARSVVADIRSQLRQTGIEPKDIAILFRTNEQPRSFETELRRAGLPYVLIGGMSFFDRKEVRDILAYLKLLDSPQDEAALLRIINTPPRGFGPKSVESLVARAVELGQPAWDVLRDPSFFTGTSTANAARHLVDLISRHKNQLKRSSLVSIAKSLIREIDYESELRRIYQDPRDQQGRWDAVQEVVNTLGAYEKRKRNPTLREFLDDLLLEGRDFDNEKDKQLRRNAIALMTLHSAKGLEFPLVYMVGMEERLLPHHRSIDAGSNGIEEERRLCYVGVTRAQRRLTLSMALTRMQWGRPRNTIPSRFLFELIGMPQKAQQCASGRWRKDSATNSKGMRSRAPGERKTRRF